MIINTLIRLDASPYQKSPFFLQEKAMARKLGLNYLYCDFRNRGLSWPLPDEYQGPFALISNTHTPCLKVPKELLNECALWLHPNSGYDNLDAAWVNEQSFPIVVGQSIRAQGVSEYILGHLFSHFARHNHQSEWSKERTWERTLLANKKVTILGKGHVGQLIGSVLSPLCGVTYFDPYIKGDDIYKGQLKDLLSQTDVLILCASLNKNNIKMLNKDNLPLLPNDALIINSARGELINQSDLLKFLKERPKAFAYLDVFENEPFQSQDFKGISNIHCTSHIAGVTHDLEERLLHFEENVLNRFLNDPADAFQYNFKHSLLHNRLIGEELI